MFIELVLVAGFFAAGLVLLAMRVFVIERVKASIKSEYDQRLEAHKAQLAGQSAVEIERLKSQLAMAAAERNIRFSRLHEKRAEVIAELYRLLKELHSAVLNYVSPMQVKVEGQTDEQRTEEKRTNAANAMGALRAYYPSIGIYIPKVTATKIEELLAAYTKHWFEFRYRVEGREGDPERYERWDSISTSVENLYESALADLEDEFRKLLGDDGVGADLTGAFVGASPKGTSEV